MGHLILTRYVDRGIVLVVGDVRAKVVLHEMMGDCVRLGVYAPESVVIYRDELYERMAADGPPRVRARVLPPVRPDHPTHGPGRDEWWER